MVNCRVPFRTSPDFVRTLVVSTSIRRFSSSCLIVLGNGVGAHPCVLANASDAWPALVRFPVLAKQQVGVHGDLPSAQSQDENGIGQKKIMAQWAALSVSVLEFRGVTSLMIFQDSTPMSLPMSIEKTKFTLRSQVYSCMPFSKPLLRSPFLCLLHHKFRGGPSPVLG